MKLKLYIKKIFDKIKNVDYIGYYNTSKLFLLFVITNLINSSLLRMMTVKNYFDYKPILGDLAFLVLIGSVGYVFKAKKRFRYYFVWSCICCALCIINSMYYGWYISFASASLLATSLQVVDVGDAVIQQVMQVSDFIYLWQPIMFLLIYGYFKRNKYIENISKVEQRKNR